ncbi:hypothetical protein E2562_009728 [Oryza meyeriana var. granulata]|uniref:Uncharacterized protein n=1 Tax=Oryza meyeriana var. granulata TaxID=110450 RepID=A0A6G1D3R4_9ORYZ|nr:hypothetical protein E2562_009728 [Oryza meyeriana var. granulata]
MRNEEDRMLESTSTAAVLCLLSARSGESGRRLAVEGVHDGEMDVSGTRVAPQPGEAAAASWRHARMPPVRQNAAGRHSFQPDRVSTNIVWWPGEFCTIHLHWSTR